MAYAITKSKDPYEYKIKETLCTCNNLIINILDENIFIFINFLFFDFFW